MKHAVIALLSFTLILFLQSSQLYAQDSTLSRTDTTIEISIEEMRNFLMLELLYYERGDIIDSLIVIKTNCDSMSAIALRSLSRERESREAADRLVADLSKRNEKLIRQRRRLTYSSIFFASTTLTAVLFIR